MAPGLLTIQRLIEDNEIEQAKTALDDYLEAYPDDVMALELAWQIAENVEEKAAIKAHVENEIEVGYDNEELVDFAWKIAATDEERERLRSRVEHLASRPRKDYLVPALLVLGAYVFGAGLIGLFLNIYFIETAKKEQQQGIMVTRVGCLDTLLRVAVIGTILTFVVGILVIVLPLILD